MLRAFLFKVILICIILWHLGGSIAIAFDDGFAQAKKIESKHFLIYYAPEVILSSVTQQLNIGLSDKLLVGKSIEQGSSLDSELSDMLDTLFMRVCDILDMRLYSFQGKIKLCQDYNQLNRIYNIFFNQDLKGTGSFYVYSLNTIYISADKFNRYVLGHEIAHAIISHYFVVQPSVKIQEVLAGYVEYQLRKSGQ